MRPQGTRHRSGRAGTGLGMPYSGSRPHESPSEPSMVLPLVPSLAFAKLTEMKLRRRRSMI